MRTWRKLTVTALLATVGLVAGAAAPAHAAFPVSTAIRTNIFNGRPNLGACVPETYRPITDWEDMVFLQDNSSATVYGNWGCPGRIGVLAVTYRDANPARETRPMSIDVELEATLYAVAEWDPSTAWPCGYESATHRIDRTNGMQDHQLPQLLISNDETWCEGGGHFGVVAIPRTAAETVVAQECPRIPGCVIP